MFWSHIKISDLGYFHNCQGFGLMLLKFKILVKPLYGNLVQRNFKAFSFP
jgi:hypothetical protein